MLSNSHFISNFAVKRVRVSELPSPLPHIFTKTTQGGAICSLSAVAGNIIVGNSTFTKNIAGSVSVCLHSSMNVNQLL